MVWIRSWWFSIITKLVSAPPILGGRLVDWWFYYLASWCCTLDLNLTLIIRFTSYSWSSCTISGLLFPNSLLSLFLFGWDLRYLCCAVSCDTLAWLKSFGTQNSMASFNLVRSWKGVFSIGVRTWIRLISWKLKAFLVFFFRSSTTHTHINRSTH